MVLRYRSFDQRVPPELLADLGLDASRVLRAGTIGFTALLTPGQRAVAERHPLVDRVEPDPEALAPFIGVAPDPGAPDRYAAAMLPGRDPGEAARAIGLDPADPAVDLAGVWLTARLTADRLSALRRDPAVDFVDFAILDGPV